MYQFIIRISRFKRIGQFKRYNFGGTERIKLLPADGTVRFRENKDQQPESMQLKYNLKCITVSKSLKVPNSLQSLKSTRILTKYVRAALTFVNYF